MRTGIHFPEVHLPPTKVSCKVPEERDICSVILEACTGDDFERKVQGLKSNTLARKQGAGPEAPERLQLHYLLQALLATRQLALPVRLYKREAPDFSLHTGNMRIGVEVTEAVNPDYVRAQMHPLAQQDDAVVDASLYKWGTQGRSRSQIREEVKRTKLSGAPWMGEDVEQEFARSINDVVHQKHSKLLSHYRRYDSDRLLIHHSQASPAIDIDKALIYTTTILADYWNKRGFDAIYVHKYHWMLCFTREVSEIIYEFPRSDAPLGIDEDLWEGLGSTEKIYLKLLEQEPSFISDTRSGESECELEDFLGFESELQALRHEWQSVRKRELDELGCTDLLKPPDRIRLMTASEVAACPAASELFRGGLLELVFRAVAEPIPEGTITETPRLHQTMASRGPEFTAAVIAILDYLSRFDDIAHWASDSRKCSALLSAIDPHR